jgi:hypothetical protein
VVLGLGPGPRDTTPLTRGPPSFRPVPPTPLAGLPIELLVPDSTAEFAAMPLQWVAHAGADPTSARYCIAVDGRLLSGAAPDGR